MDSYNSPTTKPLLKGTQIIWYLLTLLEVLLAFRFLLKLTAANAEAGFSSLIYGLSAPFVSPFIAVFSKTYVSESIFEWTTLLAMLVYWIVALGITQLLVMSKTVSTPEAAAKLDQQDS